MDEQVTNQDNPMAPEFAPDAELADFDAAATDLAQPAPARVSRGTMIVMGLLLSGGASVYLMSMRSIPQFTSAKNKAAEEEVEKAIATLDKRGDQAKTLSKMFDSSDEVVEVFFNYPAQNQIPLDDLKKNPFLHMGKGTNTGDGASNMDRVNAREAKEAEKRRNEQKKQLEAALSQLKLRTILFGKDSRAVMINNTILSEGQTIEGFNVTSIKKQSVTLSAGDMQFKLQMH